jgi:hypothetical protein
LAPSCSRSAQFFADANDIAEPLLDDDEDDEEDEDDDDDELLFEDDDEEDAVVVVLEELFLLPQPAAVTARLSTATRTSRRRI